MYALHLVLFFDNLAKEILSLNTGADPGFDQEGTQIVTGLNC